MSDEEEIYLNARKRVIAVLQKITFNEFIPSLGMDIGIYNGYNEEIHPGVYIRQSPTTRLAIVKLNSLRDRK